MKQNSLFLSLDCSKLLWLLFSVLVVIILFNSLNRWFDNDEFEAVHTSWKILQGEEIYVDFFQHHHPLFYYLLTPVIAISGENITTIITIRLIVFFMLLLIFFFTYYLSIKLFNKETGLISLLLLTTAHIFFTEAIEIIPDVPQTLFGLLSVLLLFTFFENRFQKNLVSSSFLLGISFLFSQKASFLILLIGVLLLIGVYKREIYHRDLLLYLSVFLLTLAPYCLYVFYTSALSPYFSFNWVLNMMFLNHFLPFNILLHSFLYNLSLWAFYLIGLLFFMKTPNQKRVAFLSLGLLMSVFFAHTPYRQYFMMAMPLIAVTSAYAICSIFKNKYILVIVLVFSIAFPFFNLLKKTRNTNGIQLEKIEYVLSITGKEDFVYDGDILFNIFRKDIDFFWFSVRPHTLGLATYQTMTEYDYNIYELIDTFKPKVISNYYIENMHDKRIAKHYVQSALYEDLFTRAKE
jgi:4-amino-4-deoxy-L-arabinose transferase-like glycosyltransferase